MNEKIDILAVLDAYERVEGSGVTLDDHIKARAAIAELIEASKEQLSMGCTCDPCNRLRSAVTNVSGGA